jgi:hypothetical protein
MNRFRNILKKKNICPLERGTLYCASGYQKIKNLMIEIEKCAVSTKHMPLCSAVHMPN